MSAQIFNSNIPIVKITTNQPIGNTFQIEGRMEIINNLGQKMVLPVNNGDLSVAINDLTPGIYFVGLEIEGKTYLQKLMVQR